MSFVVVGTTAYGCDLDVGGPYLKRADAEACLSDLVDRVEGTIDRFVWGDGTAFDKDALVAFRVVAREAGA